LLVYLTVYVMYLTMLFWALSAGTTTYKSSRLDRCFATFAFFTIAVSLVLADLIRL
jgi:hypothetical protein